MADAHTPGTSNSRLEAVSESVYTRVLARLSMIVATTVVLPVGMFLAHRTLNTIDGLQENVAELSRAYVGQVAAQERMASDIAELAGNRYTFVDGNRLERRVDVIDGRVRDLEKTR